MKLLAQLSIDVAAGQPPISLSGAGATDLVTSLNADLLDGQHGSYYLAAVNLTGTVPSSALNGTYAGITIIGVRPVVTDGGALPGSAYASGPAFSAYVSPYGGSASDFPEGDGGGAGVYLSRYPDSGGDLATGSWQLWSSSRTDSGSNNLWFRKYSRVVGDPGNREWGDWYKLWHAGNVGASSGLDADLLDGQEGSYYLNTSSDDQTKTGNLTLRGSVDMDSGAATGSTLNIGPVASDISGNGATINLRGGSGNYWHLTARGDINSSEPEWLVLYRYSGTSAAALKINQNIEFGFGGEPSNGYRVSVSGSIYSTTGIVTSTAGVGLFGDGSAASPSIGIASDTDTGLFKVNSNILGFSTAGVERARLRAGGTLQIGNTAALSSSEANLKLLVGTEWTSSDAIAQFGGSVRLGYGITHDSIEGIRPNTNSTGQVGSTSARYARGYFTQMNVGSHTAVPDQGSGTSLQVAPRILSGDPEIVNSSTSYSWNWLQGLIAGMGYPDAPALLGPHSNNLLTDWDARGGNVSTSTSGASVLTNPSYPYKMLFIGKARLRSYASYQNNTGVSNTCVYEFTDPTTTQSITNSLVYTGTGYTAFVPYIIFRQPANITNIKVELKLGTTEAGSSYTTIFDAAPVLIKHGLWRGAMYKSSSGAHALFGVKFTLTHGGGATNAEILEIGLADNWGIHGRHQWASPHYAQSWTGAQTFGAATVFNSTVTLTTSSGHLLGNAGTGRMYLGTNGSSNTRSYFAGRNSGDTDYRWDAEFGWDGANQRWYFDTVPYVATNPVARKYSESIGDGYATSITVTHNLGTRDVQVAIRRNSDNVFGSYATSITATNDNQITLAFGAAPTASQYRVIVTG